MAVRDIHEITRGKWRGILTGLGIPEVHLTGKHCSCPICGGEDRFRWDNKDGKGSSICNQCGSMSGPDLVMAYRKVDFTAARKMILEQCSVAPVEAPRARHGSKQATEKASDIWARCIALDPICPPVRWLEARGIHMDRWPSQIRHMPRAMYWHEDGTRTPHPAMVVQYVSPDAAARTVQFTYLNEDGTKADVPKSRKLMAGELPCGGAVRLAPSAETMGIAEGVETALAAMIMHGVPVWATLTAGALVKWQPPETCKSVIIFGDSDESYTGQAAAYALANKLAAKGLHVDVRIPGLEVLSIGDDWNDVLAAERR